MTMPRLAKRSDKPRRPGYSLAGWIILLSLITTPLWSADQAKPAKEVVPQSPSNQRSAKCAKISIASLPITLEEAEESLSTNSRDQQLVFGAAMNGDSSPDSILHEVIADYRVRRIY